MIGFGDHVEAVLGSDLSNEEKLDLLTDNLYRDYLRTWPTSELFEVAAYARYDISKDPELQRQFPRWQRLLSFHLGELMRRARAGEL